MSDRTYNRLDLASEQLAVALSLFLDKQSYAATITLAGAAEEVFGVELRRRGGHPVLDRYFEEFARSCSTLRRSESDG